MHAIAGENADGAIVHLHREVHRELALAVAQDVTHAGIEADTFCDGVELCDRGVEGILRWRVRDRRVCHAVCGHPYGLREDVLQEFRITKTFAADGRRHAAIPKTVAMIRFWAMISPLLVPRSCPLRIMCITSKPLRALQAVRKEPNPKQYLARLLTNR